MGTINYNSNKFVTLGIEPYDFNDMKEAYIQDTQDQDIPDQVIFDQISEYYSCDYANADQELKKLALDNFKVSIENGYYEGLYIDIEYNNLFFYDQEEKDATIKEAESIKQFLVSCAGMGFVSCIPFWYTIYKNYDETLKDIEDGFNKMMDDINNTPIDQEEDGI